MNHSEISMRLALAIGYLPEDVHAGFGDTVLVRRHFDFKGDPYKSWYTFDYADPRVIWPVAKKYDMFPWQAQGKWFTTVSQADTPEEAVALAVIAAHRSTGGAA